MMSCTKLLKTRTAVVLPHLTGEGRNFVIVAHISLSRKGLTTINLDCYPQCSVRAHGVHSQDHPELDKYLIATSDLRARADMSSAHADIPQPSLNIPRATRFRQEQPISAFHRGQNIDKVSNLRTATETDGRLVCLFT